VEAHPLAHQRCCLNPPAPRAPHPTTSALGTAPRSQFAGLKLGFVEPTATGPRTAVAGLPRTQPGAAETNPRDGITFFRGVTARAVAHARRGIGCQGAIMHDQDTYARPRAPAGTSAGGGARKAGGRGLEGRCRRGHREGDRQGRGPCARGNGEARGRRRRGRGTPPGAAARVEGPGSGQGARPRFASPIRGPPAWARRRVPGDERGRRHARQGTGERPRPPVSSGGRLSGRPGSRAAAVGGCRLRPAAVRWRSSPVQLPVDSWWGGLARVSGRPSPRTRAQHSPWWIRAQVVARHSTGSRPPVFHSGPTWHPAAGTTRVAVTPPPTSPGPPPNGPVVEQFTPSRYASETYDEPQPGTHPRGGEPR
jgi:hypothetical protein